MHEDEVPAEIVQIADEAAELARIATEKKYELVQVRAALADLDFELPIVRQMRELAPALAEYQSARLREISELALAAGAWESPVLSALRELAPALADFASTQLPAVVSTLQTTLPILLASQPWTEINRIVTKTMTEAAQAYSTQSILAGNADPKQPAAITVLQPAAQDPASDTPAKIAAAPQPPARRDDQVIPQWLWVLALAAVSFTVAAAQERLSSEAQTTVNYTITWFGLLLTLYALCNSGKR